MKKYILYNALAGNTQGAIHAKKMDAFFIGHELVYLEIAEIPDFREFFSSIEECDDVIVCGGDGTLNRFLNSTSDLDIKNRIFYYAMGSGNDFLRDLEKPLGSEPFLVNDFLRNLPEADFGGTSIRFINGIGYGIDGYCCAEGDRLRKKAKKKINYTTIAIRGLLYAFRPKKGRVTVDGETFEYKKIWMAPTMRGRFFGGGMMVTPEQDRDSDMLTVCVVHDCGALRLLCILPTIFKGNHVKFKKVIDFYKGREISVEYDEPCDLQADGEVFLGVRGYTARIAEPQKAPKKTTRRAPKKKVDVPQENEQLSLELV